MTLHCVGMNLGGADPLDFDYLDDIRRIARTVGAAWISDHLCFTAHAGRHYHDLLPLPFSDEAVRHIAGRIVQVQEFLGRRMVVENVSAYLCADAPLTESEFLAAVCAEADCELAAEAVAEHAAFAPFGWLPDLVRIEWLCHDLYYRDDDLPLDLVSLQRNDPSRLYPRPANRVAWMHSSWPVYQIWEMHRGDGEPPAMQIEHGDWYLVVEREAVQGRALAVDAPLWRLLDDQGDLAGTGPLADIDAGQV